MNLREDPIASLQNLSKKAVGFFLKQKKSPEQAEVIGVDLGQSHLLVVALSKESGKPTLSHFRLEPRPATPDAITATLKTIFKEEGLDPKGIRIAIKGQGIVIRILTFPQMKKEDFASAIQYEAEKYIPFKLSEVILDFQILREDIQQGNLKRMETLLVAVKQKEIYQHLRPFQEADLRVELIDVSAFAFANLIESLFPEIKDRTIGLLDMGTETSTFGILVRGRPVFMRDISWGGADILKLLKRRLGEEREAALAVLQDPSKQSPEFTGLVEQGLAPLVTELKLSLEYYLGHVSDAEPAETLYIAGGGSRFVLHSDFLERETKIPVRRPEVFSKINIGSDLDPSLLRKNEDLLPVVLGVCVRP